MLLKLWLETRTGFLSLAAVHFAMVAIYIGLPAAPVEWDARLHRLMFAFALAAVLASVQAFSWTFGHVMGEAQPTLFTLSMPVSRRRLVVAQAALGAAQLAALVVASCAVLWLSSPSLRAGRDEWQMLSCVAVVLGGQAMLYALGMLLASTSPIVWMVYCYAAVNALLWQLSMFQAWSGQGLWVRETGRLVLPFALAQVAATTAACLVVSGAALYAAARVFERRDF